MRFRIRGPNGVATISLEQSATIDHLRRYISEKTELTTFELLCGYPPQPLHLEQFDGELRIIDSGLKLHGEQLIAKRVDLTAILKHPLGEALPLSAVDRLPSTRSILDGPASISMASLRAESDESANLPLSLSRKANDVSTDPPEVPVPTHAGTLVLRVMPDDNSCLWRALGAAVLGSALDGVTELRSLVASQIQAQPDVYTKAVLDKSPDAYCAWIQRDDAWGGYIEMGILAQQFDIEVCSISVREGRIDKFNEGRPTRCILVYSGIHYDVLALSPSEPPHAHADVSDDFDVKVFDSADDVLLIKAQELCAILQKRHYYTDTAGFAIKCNRCGWQGRGERSATEHAKQTGHMDFGEA